MATYTEGFNALNKPNYVSVPQGKVYINGILIDECYDIQYMYQELKQPIYGYNSKYYDAVLPGQVGVAGSFTINYIHDAYLLKVLQKSQLDRMPISPAKLAQKRKQELEKEVVDRKSKLIEIKNITEKQKTDKPKITALSDEVLANKENIDKLKSELSVYIHSAEAEIKKEELAFQDFIDSLESWKKENILECISILEDDNIESLNMLSVKQMTSNDVDVKDAVELYQFIDKMKDDFILTREARNLVVRRQEEVYNQKKVELNSLKNESSIDKDKIGFMLHDLSTIKSRMESINEEISRELNSSTLNDVRSNWRAEARGSFTLVVEYNNKSHKVIQEVELVGHSHVMGQTGRPVQEVYQFIAKNVE
jgi:acyl carrier protein phosphodiesterase